MKKIATKPEKTKKKASPKFDADFLKKIQVQLEKERDRLTKELSAIADKSKNKDFPQYGDEEDDNVKEIEEFTVSKPLEMGVESELRDTIKSLKRLSQNAYGICKYCDKPIDTRRLLARPTSSSCVACKKTLTEEA